MHTPYTIHLMDGKNALKSYLEKERQMKIYSIHAIYAWRIDVYYVQRRWYGILTAWCNLVQWTYLWMWVFEFWWIVQVHCLLTEKAFYRENVAERVCGCVYRKAKIIFILFLFDFYLSQIFFSLLYTHHTCMICMGMEYGSLYMYAMLICISFYVGRLAALKSSSVYFSLCSIIFIFGLRKHKNRKK